jgi:iron complex transport system permease protein
MKRPAGTLALAALLLALLALAALACGSAGFGWGANGELLMLRLPRVLAALAAGLALGLGGANQQGVFRNPLADPGLTGVFGGALLGIALLLAGATEFTWQHRWALPTAAFAGALATSAALVWLGRGRSTAKLLLTGLGLNAFTAAGTLLLAARFPEARDILINGAAGDWLGSATLELAWLPILGCVLAALLLLTQASALDRLALGEDVAFCLGTDVAQTRRAGVLLTALAAAAAVSLVGQVAFIGLLAPHHARALVGPRHRAMLPLAGLLGAGLLLLADTLGRSLWTHTPVSAAAMTALLGAPAFVWIASRRHE